MIEIGGIWYPCDHKDRKIWPRDLETLDEAFKYVKNWDCAVDGGAFIGLWARKMAERFGTIHAFEIVPDNIECLKLNAPQNVAIYAAALGEKDAIAPVSIEDGQLYGRLDGDGRKLGSVPVFPLDSFNLKPGLVKLDLDGYEFFAIKGMMRTLVANPVLVIEDKPMCRGRYTDERHMPLLHDIGYRTVFRQRVDCVMVR